jgi:hypothetical protein
VFVLKLGLRLVYGNLNPNPNPSPKPNRNLNQTVGLAETSSYCRDNGDRINNWEVEIDALHNLYNMLGEHYYKTCSWTNAIAYYRKAFAVLERWVLKINLSESERTDYLSEEQINNLFDVLSSVKNSLSIIYREIDDWNNA